MVLICTGAGARPMAHKSSISPFSESNAGLNENEICNKTHTNSTNASDSLQQNDQCSAQNEVSRSLMIKRFLVIANVSKKPNMKTLIYSAAAHGFSVAIVGLPNMSISDLHLSEEIVGQNVDSSDDREHWRNVNKNKCSESTSSSCNDSNKNEGSSNCRENETINISSVVSMTSCNIDTTSRVSEHSRNTEVNQIVGTTFAGSCTKLDDHLRDIKSESDFNNTYISDDQSSRFESASKIKSNTNAEIDSENEFSILRFETLIELKSFLTSHSIKLFGIEIMDEGKLEKKKLHLFELVDI